MSALMRRELELYGGNHEASYNTDFSHLWHRQFQESMIPSPELNAASQACDIAPHSVSAVCHWT